MEIIFRKIPHTSDEVVMGQNLWFPDSLVADVISATANINGFTPLNAIARRYGWNNDLLKSASEQCNNRNEIAVINELSPKLLLVPSTKGKGDTDFLIKDLLSAANTVSADVLNFTHFGFIQNKLPRNEIQSILNFLFDISIKYSIRVIIWDVDYRFYKEMKQIYKLKIESYFNKTTPNVFIFQDEIDRFREMLINVKSRVADIRSYYPPDNYWHFSFVDAAIIYDSLDKRDLEFFASYLYGNNLFAQTMAHRFREDTPRESPTKDYFPKVEGILSTIGHHVCPALLPSMLLYAEETMTEHREINPSHQAEHQLWLEKSYIFDDVVEKIKNNIDIFLKMYASDYDPINVASTFFDEHTNLKNVILNSDGKKGRFINGF